MTYRRGRLPELYYNTVVGPESAAVAGMWFRDVAFARARNNLIWNPGRDSSACYRLDGPSPFQPRGSDYNDLYASGPGASVARLRDTLYPLLDDWRRASGLLDSHSLARDPQFVTPRDYHLLFGSPCRDAGIRVPGIKTDLEGDERDSLLPDIGADEYGSGAVAEPRPGGIVSSPALTVVPGAQSVRVVYRLDRASPVRLRLYDASGRAVLKFTAGRQPSGRHETTLDMSHLAPGVYLLHLTAGQSKQTRKLVRLNR